ncbi:MAG: protein-disulfide reductase DsbD domain-containing protein, partial [Paracoccaceae bacterium]
TYWRDPGEAGVPPSFDWSGSQNVALVEVMWPRPEIFISFGMRTVGYSGDLVLPLRVTPKNAELPISLAVHARMGVCKEICVIEEVELSKDIAPDLRPIGYKQIRRAVASVPMPVADAAMRLVSCRIVGTGRDREMHAELEFDTDPGHTDIVVEGHENLWVRKTHITKQGGSVHLEAQLRLPMDVSWIDRSSLRMTVLAETFAADIQGCVPTG